MQASVGGVSAPTAFVAVQSVCAHRAPQPSQQMRPYASPPASNLTPIPILIPVPVPLRVGMIVPPCPVGGLVSIFESVEIFVAAVVFLGPASIGAIFVLIPLVIVVTLAIVVSRLRSPVRFPALIILRPLPILPALVPLRALVLL